MTTTTTTHPSWCDPSACDPGQVHWGSTETFEAGELSVQLLLSQGTDGETRPFLDTPGYQADIDADTLERLGFWLVHAAAKMRVAVEFEGKEAGR